MVQSNLEMAHNQNNHSYLRSQSEDLSQPPPRVLLMTHSSNALPTFPGPSSFQRRTVEGARQLRESLSNVIREIEPLVETARTVNAGMSSLLNRPQTEANTTSNLNSGVQNDSYYINLGVPDVTNEGDPAENANNVHDHNLNPTNANNNNTEDSDTVVEAQELLKIILKYLPFVLILLAKTIYDYFEGLFILVTLFVTFAHSNSVVKREALKRHRRNKFNLIVELLYIFACLWIIHYMFVDNLHQHTILWNLVLIRVFNEPLTVWNFLWILTITDFTLKLFTVTFKILLTMLPAAIIEFKKRGKIYLLVEAISQMYRSIATIQPWLYYLLESYHGPHKFFAAILSAFYMISKGSDLMSKIKLLKMAFFKLLQNVNLGSSPSKDQIQTAGDHCPICHDEYDSPVLLQCRHIFCDGCVTTWFDREQTCPLCRAKIVDDPSWRDGSTTYFVQLY